MIALLLARSRPDNSAGYLVTCGTTHTRRRAVPRGRFPGGTRRGNGRVGAFRRLHKGRIRAGRTDALRSHQPGDTVVIVSRREGAERRATTVLGKRGT